VAVLSHHRQLQRAPTSTHRQIAEQPLLQVSPIIVINLGANRCLATQDLQIVACVVWSDPIYMAGLTEPIFGAYFGDSHLAADVSRWQPPFDCHFCPRRRINPQMCPMAIKNCIRRILRSKWSDLPDRSPVRSWSGVRLCSAQDSPPQTSKHPASDLKPPRQTRGLLLTIHYRIRCESDQVASPPPSALNPRRMEQLNARHFARPISRRIFLLRWTEPKPVASEPGK